MTWLVGVDEAGYGPNLGPLAIAASGWKVFDFVDPQEESLQSDLYHVLAPVVGIHRGDAPIAIADSKQLYKSGGSLVALELGVFAALDSHGPDNDVPRNWRSLVDHLRADPGFLRNDLPWHQGFDPPLPLETSNDKLRRLGARLAEACRHGSVAPPVLRARMVFPAEFNDLVDRYGTKGAVLSHVSLRLLRELLESLSPNDERMPAACCVLDKQGGRNRYASLIDCHFPEHHVETLVESRSESRYQWGPDPHRLRLAFRAKGESFFPTALASMTAKYLREISMQAFNQYWQSHLPGLKPTAGYPVDAKRFKRDIAACQAEHGVEDRRLWRIR